MAHGITEKGKVTYDLKYLFKSHLKINWIDTEWNYNLASYIEKSSKMD